MDRHCASFPVALQVASEVTKRMHRRMLSSLFHPWRELTSHLVAAGDYAQHMYWQVNKRLAMVRGSQSRMG